MSVLDELVAGALADADLRASELPLAELQGRVRSRQPDVRDALAALRRGAAHGTAVIAEVKRASPSKGALASITDPSALAERYQAGGASVISVLTEQRRFAGSLDDLVAVRQRVQVPVLRKDFIASEYQVWESRYVGADMILLIVAALPQQHLVDLMGLAHELDMQVLVEVHDRAELDRAVAADARIIGVNARNLKTLDIDLAVCDQLLPLVPSGVVAVGESGVAGVADVRRYVAGGAHAVLVGEALVKHGDPHVAITEFAAVSRDHTNLAGQQPGSSPTTNE